MFEIPWIVYGSRDYRYEHDKYLFKWKREKSGDRYEIYENGKLMRNNLTYWDFLSKAQKIMSGERLPADIWK